MKNVNLILLLAVLFFASCAPTYYKPKTINVPLLESRNDVQISAHTDGQDLSIQTAYAATNNLGISLDFFKYKNSSNSSNKYEHKYQSAELGLGYFTKLDKRLHFEIYGVAGLGSLSKFSNPTPSEYYSSAKGNLSSNYSLIGIQPSIGLKYKHLELAYSLRIVRTNYYNTTGNYIWNDANEVDYLNAISHKDLFEQALTIRTGFENLKFQFQILKSKEFRNGSHWLDTNSNNRFFDGGSVSIGLAYNFNITSVNLQRKN